MLSTRRFFSIIAFLVFLCTLGYLLIYLDVPAAHDELKVEAAKTLLQVGVFGVIGAYVKYLFDERQRQTERFEIERQKQLESLEQARIVRETQHKSRLEVLNLITTSYWQVKKAFHIIYAHKSAKSYGEQMRQMIDFRLQLQRLDNEIIADIYPLDNNEIIANALCAMHKFLGEVIDEWKEHYIELSRLQNEDKKLPAGEKKVPAKLEALPKLQEARRSNYRKLHFLFEKAVNPIRQQLREEKKVA